jgi:hypothetical protein
VSTATDDDAPAPAPAPGVTTVQAGRGGASVTASGAQSGLPNVVAVVTEKSAKLTGTDANGNVVDISIDVPEGSSVIISSLSFFTAGNSGNIIIRITFEGGGAMKFKVKPNKGENGAKARVSPGFKVTVVSSVVGGTLVADLDIVDESAASKHSVLAAGTLELEAIVVEDDDQGAIGLAVGLVVGLILLFVVAGVVFFLCRKESTLEANDPYSNVDYNDKDVSGYENFAEDPYQYDTIVSAPPQHIQ